MEARFVKLDPNAVIPRRANPSDIGLDITIIGIKHPSSVNRVVYFRTGLAVQPPDGYYFELYARSSFHKAGWQLANSVGIIDPAYRGEIIMACAPLGDWAVHPEFPTRAGQLVLRKAETDFHITTVDIDELSATDRGTGGFGSSDA